MTRTMISIKFTVQILYFRTKIPQQTGKKARKILVLALVIVTVSVIVIVTVTVTIIVIVTVVVIVLVAIDNNY